MRTSKSSRNSTLITDLLAITLLAGLWGISLPMLYTHLVPNAWFARDSREDFKVYQLLTLSLSSIGLFILPVLTYPNARRHLQQVLQNVKYPKLPTTLTLSAISLAASSLLQRLSEWSIGLLPTNWGISTSDYVLEQLTPLLQFEAAYKAPLIFLVLALLPSVGEELFFRAYIQERMIQFQPKTYHRNIWIVAILFSLVHGSAVGFLSRLVLALILGYSYHYTRNIALPITIHLVNNSTSLFLLHLEGTI